ncbi:MAG: V-type ATP synthase subunit A, partial [Alicyclobacillus mali]|nr:V-type ATP synthase subunit A [Alicyclobacillus mali (ex Roth et al. 2021)]
NWLLSYSLYQDRLDEWINENVARDWSSLRSDAMKLLQEESELEEIVRLVGVDALSAGDRLVLEAAKSIREDYLHQNAFHDVDTYTSLNKQYRMLKLIMGFYYKGRKAVEAGANIRDLFNLPVRERIGRAKYTPEAEVNTAFYKIEEELNQQMEALVSKEVV